MLKKILKYSQSRYLLSGISAFIIEFGCFMLILALTDQLVLANTISFIIGTAAGLIFHKYWTFAGNHQYRTVWQTIAVFIVALFNLIITNIFISFLVNHLHLPPYMAKVSVIALIVTWNYLLFNNLIFKLKKVKD